MSGYTDIIFDLDGTLVDSAEGIKNSLQYAFDQVGINAKNMDFNKFIGPPLAEGLKQNLPNEFSDEILLASTIKHMRSYYASHGVHQCLLYPGIDNLLSHLKQNNKRLFVATSKPLVFAKEMLSNLSVHAFFEGIDGNPVDAAPNTKGEIISRLINVMQIKQENRKLVMIGDRYHDIEGAHENGIDSIGVTYGYGSSEELSSYQPTRVINSINELHDALYT